MIRPRRLFLAGLAAFSAMTPLVANPAAAIAVQPSAGTRAPERIRVLLDDSYPPYVFRDQEGGLQGILPDLWARWSAQTGIPVELTGGEWAEMQRRFNAGEGDVLDTVFETPERDKIYDFSAPYATIDVPILFDASLSGIHDATTLRGFTVGVKDGDACIEVLNAQGIDSFKRYPSYEALIDAAARGEIRVSCIDRPPATYYLIKTGLEDRFRISPPLYFGQFHWVVRKGEGEVREIIRAGFERITPGQRQTVIDHWLGQPLRPAFNDGTVRNIALALLITGGVGLLLLAWVHTLRRQVAAKTRDLTTALGNLSASELRFRTLFDAINDAILLQDAETGTVRLINRRTRDLFGHDPTQRQMTLSDIATGVPPYDAETALQRIHDTANGPQTFEWQARHRDGRLIWLDVDLRRVVLDESGPQVLAVLRDITERKEGEEQLTRTIDALTRSNSDLERFTYAASHDLREPLATLVRYTQLLDRRIGRQDPQTGEFATIIVTAAKQMMLLVEGLLDFSRVEAAGHQFETVETGRALTVALGFLDVAIEESKAVIVTEGTLPTVAADEVQLIQLFQNLIGNALKYRDRTRSLQITISAELNDRMWRISVADNGIGIEAAYLDQIFVIFKRLHPQGTIPGVGIGLALCKRIVEHHGGRLWAESSPGIGTVFHFTLPAP